MNIKETILEISPYVPGKSGCEDGLKLSANENPLGCSPLVLEELHKKQVLHRYPDGSCSALRAAIAAHNNIEEKNILCGNGSDEIIALIMSGFTREGDDILYSQYGFLMYKIYALSFGVNPIAVKEENYRTEVENILAAVTTKTRIVFVANPNNPTGSYISREELFYLRKNLREDIILVIDGAYSEYVEKTDYEDGFSLVQEFDNVIATRTFSKIYGLGGLRLGYGYMSGKLIDILNRIRSPFNVNSLAQKLGKIALADQDFIKKSIIHNRNGLKILEEFFANLKIKVLPSVGNFITIDLGAKEKADNFVQYLVDNKIIVRSIGGYDLANMVRITIGNEKENNILMKVVKKYL